MEFRYFLNVLIKKVWIILLIPFIAVTAASYISYFLLKPHYEASTTIYVISNNYNTSAHIAYDDILVSQQLIKDYRELIKSRGLTKIVLEQLKISGMSPRELSKKITVNPKNETRLFEIKITDTDPIRAKLLVDKLSGVFIDKAKDMMIAERLEIIDYAEIPVKPVKPNHLLNIMVAFIVGLFTALGIVFFTEYLDDTIKSAVDVEKYLELTVLGTIPIMDIK